MRDHDKIARMLAPNGATRREFLSHAAALGLTTAAASLIWKGAAAQTPSRGGHFRLGLAGASTTDSLNPATYTDTYMMTVGFAIRDNLISMASDGTLQPGLAESWEATADAKEWTFHLRKGVEFNNGKSLEAEDVLVSMNQHRGEDSTSSGKALFQEVTDIVAPDKHTVVFKLEAGNVDFPVVHIERQMGIVPAKDGKPDWQSGVGTGAYILNVDDFKVGVRATLELNPNRWNQEVGHFDSAEVIGINDSVARHSALASGAVDAITRVDLKTAHMLAAVSGLRVEKVTGLKHYNFAMNTQLAPYDNNDVRLALKYAVNRQELLEKVLNGYGTIANDHPIAPANRYFSADIPQREYDPDKAKFHLKKAGLDGLKMDMSASDGIVDGGVDMALLYRETAAAMGIDINVVREPADGWWNDVWIKKPFIVSYWGGRATEDSMFTVAYSSTAPWNDTRWVNEAFDALLAQARGEFDEAKRAEMYRDLQLMVRDEGGAVIPLYADHVFAVSDNVQFGKLSGVWECDGARAIERWWYS